MFDMQLIKNVLLVLPLSVIPTWSKEFSDWAPGIKVDYFHGPAAKRLAVLRQCMMKRSVCITTYGLMITQWQTLSETVHGREFVWDYIILDEGHKIKRPSKTTKRLHAIPSKNRIILTGTPIQNRVRDLWALMDWVTQGSVLGTQKTFKSSYELPIERARQRDATACEIQRGNHMAESLRKLTNPYILRRTKEELMLETKESCQDMDKVADEGQDMAAISTQPSFPKLSNKNDLVVWVYLSEIQEKIYRDFTQLDSVKALLLSNQSRNALVYLTVLKKICDHPRLLSTKACIELGLQLNDGSFSCDQESDIEDCAANRIDNISDETLIKESAKLEFLIQLLTRLREEGHRTLVFSLSRKMLNIIQRILINLKFKIMRLDGRVTKLKDRERRVKLFQEDSSYEVFLLTTQVGGVGLTLTGADRAVIYDPSWNPATDAQSVDRIYRIGQKKNVLVYRLITCGSVEEKIYRRQVFKNSFIQQSTCGKKDPYRYFTRQDLAELFTLDDVKSSSTQKQLEELHGHQRKFDSYVQKHVDYIHTLKMFGISDHDLMFTQNPDDFDYEREMANSDFNNIVENAQNRLRIESNQLTGCKEAELRWGVAERSRIKDNTNKFPEPMFPIEGLSERMDALQLPPYLKMEAKNSLNYQSDVERSHHFHNAEDGDNNDVRDGLAGSENTTASDFLQIDSDSSNASINKSDSERQCLKPKVDNEALTALREKLGIWNKNSETKNESKDSLSINLNQESLETPERPSFDASETSLQKSRRRLPSFDDDVVILSDSPEPDKPRTSIFHTSGALARDEIDSDDELILAVDSPLMQTKNRPDLSEIPNSANNSEILSEVQDSALFSESADDEEPDESWKKAFSIHSSNADQLSKDDSALSFHSPIIRRHNKRRQVIESDGSDSDDENLLQLGESSKPSRRSVCSQRSFLSSTVQEEADRSRVLTDAMSSFNKINDSSNHSDSNNTESYFNDSDHDDLNSYDEELPLNKSKTSSVNRF